MCNKLDTKKIKLETLFVKEQDGCGVDVLNANLAVTDSFAVNAIK